MVPSTSDELQRQEQRAQAGEPTVTRDGLSSNLLHGAQNVLESASVFSFNLDPQPYGALHLPLRIKGS